MYKNWLWRKESDTRFFLHIWRYCRLRWINYSPILFFCLSNICCSSQTTGQNAVPSPEVRNFSLCCPKFLPWGRIILNICSPQNKVNTPKCFLYSLLWLITHELYVLVQRRGRPQRAKVRLAQNFWEEKGYIYVREARTKCLLLGTDILNPKSCTLSYSQKDRVFVLSRLRI